MSNSNGYKPGTSIDPDEHPLIQEGVTGYTIDYIGDDGVSFEIVVVWEDERLRNRIVELLNRYGERD